MSPAARDFETSRLAFNDWIAPLMLQCNGDRALSQKYVIDQLGGSVDESSPVYGYCFHKKNEAATIQLCRGCGFFSDIGGAHQKLKIIDSMHSAGLNQDA